MDKLAQSLRGKIEEMLDPPTSGSTAADVTLIDVPDHPFGILRARLLS
ncbi:MAG TPA: hypothetical protein VFJ18_06360 [Pararhizobium sp.]|nr:hypothetical protein [Pararhizobium sp.]